MDDMSAFNDLIDSEKVLPTFGLRILVGLDEDGKERVLLERCGTIDSTQLIGILETIQHRLMFPL